ncbi:LytR/AlgR family response regulator transcription factor [Patulibacter defluvii]|uniref:LytR/AlgR family response regulator transcription factor n=1 Tax=Patulibacter defluvii TaxID=3095358 RepID=UPI002A75CB6E|nr:LytTR family DNA-binding domain-containing protein [Patulibacter sp. DM4]
MSAPLRVLAVDDERPALEDLARLLRASELVGDVLTAGGGEEALAVLADGGEHVDALLLDVRMPGLDGVQLARVLRRFARPPAVVFVTAHESAAVAAFELEATDYLLKPVAAARLRQALERVVQERVGTPAAAEPACEQPGRGAAPEGGELVPVDNLRGGGTRLVPRSSILYLEANGDYVRIHADDGRFLLRARLGDLEQRWRAHGFVRVHRGYVVNLARAVELHPQLGGTAALRFPDGSEVPVARRQVGELRRRLRA